jgi:hypothetical protein
MKRIAFVLAAAFLGTGCVFVDDHCDPTVTIEWTTFENAEGFVTPSCATAGVEAIDVWVNGARVGVFDCFGPSGTVPLSDGGNELRVEGIDALGRIAYRDWFSFDAPACGHNGTLQTNPAEGFVDVDYAFSPVNACSAPPSFIWLQVRDDVAGQIAFVENGVGAAQQCSLTAAAPRYRLPFGAFTLVGIEEVVPIGGGAFGVTAANCTPHPFDIGAGATTTVQPVLFDTAIGCF